MARPKGERPDNQAGVEVDASGKTLVATIETTGDQASEEHGVLAEGSNTPAGTEVFAEAPTLASGSGQGQGGTHAGLGVGGKLGRLEIGKVLGDGAFGVVVAAYDPKLKRKLAIKILKPEVFSSAGGEEAQARLLREARAMARVEHANVVTVHDIGTVDGQVFVAMQFVEGNLRTWLTEEKRAWSDIVEKFCQAGRGLAAAHDVGLVHRDFKPDNVLVGKSGEVRVADFGLVSISEAGAENIASTEFSTAPQSSDTLEITRAGALMGTALYMAPEQHLGNEATAASDQFAFCVALYWALYGSQPFAGNDYRTLRKHVLAGELQPPPTTASVPRWISKLLRKGMALRPEDRHPSMLQLVALLSRDRAAIRRRWLALGGAVLAGAGLTGYLVMQDGSYNPCENQGQRLQSVWDEPAKRALQTSFAGHGRDKGFAGLATAVDGYTQDWVSTRTQVCEATHLFGEQSDNLLDKRMSCLDQRLNYLQAFLSELAPGATPQTLDAALAAASDLPGLELCTGSQVAGAKLDLPPDERQAASDFDAHVGRAQALFDLGQRQAAKDYLESNWNASVRYAPSLARALALRGRAKADLGQLDAGESDLRASIEQATVAEDDLLVASSWLALMHLSGVEREDYEAGHQMGELARLAMVRGKAGALSMANIDKAKATILLREGKYPEAIDRLLAALPVYQKRASKPELAKLLASLGDGMAGDLKYQEAVDYFRLALANIESTLGDRHPENIYVLNNLAVALKGLGDIKGAHEALDKSLLAVETSYGAESREVVTVLVNLGNIIRREGDLEGAQEALRRAIRVGKKSFEAGHPTVTKAMMNLAIVYASGGQHALATETFREVLLRTEASFPEDHPDGAMALNNLGEALMLEKKYEEALDYVQRAVAMKGRLYGGDHPRGASSIAALASVYVGLGKASEAAAAYARALAIYEEALGDEHALTIALYSELGRLHEAEGAAGKATPLLQKAIAGRGQDDSGLAQAEDRFALARAYWALGERGEARELIDTLDARSGSEEADSELRARLRKWRNTH